MKFSYKARTKDGELQIGDVEAVSHQNAIDILQGHELFILNLEPVRKENILEHLASFFERVKTSELMIFTRQFATLLSSQVPLSDSLKNLYNQTSSPVLKEVIKEIFTDIESGFSLSQALSRHPKIFSDFYANMVKSAEVTGRLSEIMEFLADYLEKQSLLVGKVRNALIYPAFVIGLFVMVVIVMLTMVIPQVVPIFKEAKVELPFITKILIGAGGFLSSWWWLVFLGFIGLLLIIIDYFQTKEGKMVFNELSLKLPLFGNLFKNLYVSRFAESVRVLLKGGLTIPQAIEISSRTISNYVYQDILREVAQSIREGKLLSQALKNSPYFPPLVSQLIAVGESTGRLENLLAKVSDFYRQQVENTVNNLVELIQPALLVIIGVLVAGLFASILLPMYTLTKSF